MAKQKIVKKDNVDDLVEMVKVGQDVVELEEDQDEMQEEKQEDVIEFEEDEDVDVDVDVDEDEDEEDNYDDLRDDYYNNINAIYNRQFYIDKTISYDLIEENKDKYIIDIDGKDFVVFKGLLDIAHKFGLKSIKTNILKLDLDNYQCVVEAIVEYQDGTTFIGHGHASKNNVNKLLADSFIAIAETRAIARALRFGNNVGLTSSDELPDKSAAVLMNDDAASMDKASNTTINKIMQYVDTDEKYEKIIEVIKKQFNANSLLDLTERQAKAILKILKNSGDDKNGKV